MKFSKKGIIAIVIIALVVLGSAIGFLIWKAQPKGATVAVSILPDSLNPILEQNTSGLNADELLFDGLVNFEVDKESGSLYSNLALAESIVQNPADKKTYTATLRDVSWHDGNPVTADDVVYSFAAYTDEANDSPKRSYLMSFIKSVSAEDDRTVKIEFINPIPEFRAYPVLTFKIVPSKYNGQKMRVNMRAGENERKFATEPVGTGPFKLATWEIGKWVTFDANGTYFGNTPQMSNLVMTRIIDPIIRMNEMRKGRVNVILETKPTDRADVAKIPNVDINSYIPYAFYEVAINTKLFPNADGRQAMAMALDREMLIPSITDQKSGVILNYGPFPSNLFAANIPEYVDKPMPTFLSYDLAKAKSLASSGGVSGQNAILLYPDSMGEFGDKMASGIVKQLAEIGLNVEAKRTGDKVFDRMVNTEKSFELALMYCEGFDNLYSSLGDWYRSNGSKNVTGIADSKLNSLFDAWEKEIVTANWIDLTLQIDKRICELSPALYLCSLEKDVYSRGLENVAIATDNPFLSAEHWKVK